MRPNRLLALDPSRSRGQRAWGLRGLRRPAAPRRIAVRRIPAAGEESAHASQASGASTGLLNRVCGEALEEDR
jgi:hypothetical protein